MNIDTGFLLLIISVFVAIFYFVGFFVSTRRLQVTGVARNKILTQALLYFIVWVGFIFIVGQSEFLKNFDHIPPPFVFFFLSILISAFGLAFFNLGLTLAKGLSYSEIIGFQCFRIFVEMALLVGAKEGLTPRVMTLHGLNFDIVTGLSALAVSWYVQRYPNFRYVRVWNWMGLGFLTIVVSVAFLAFPTPIRVFTEEPSNIWVTVWPYIMLPGFLVWAALVGHLILRRKMQLDPKFSVGH